MFHPYMLNRDYMRQPSTRLYVGDRGSLIRLEKQDSTSSLLGATASNGLTDLSYTPIPIEFPEADPSWYYYGYPGTVPAGNSSGKLIDYIPISFYAKKDEKIYVGFPPNPDYVGYLNSDKEFTDNLVISGKEYKRGDFVFAILLSRNAADAQGSQLLNESYWALLSEVSNIKPGQTVTKSVAVTSGVTTQESKTFSYSIGSTAGFKVGFSGSEISAQLSASLTRSFSKAITVSTQMTVTDTVTFEAQTKQQRAALYQFHERYRLYPGKALYDLQDYYNGTSDDNAKFYSSRFYCTIKPPPTFNYQSRYFATSFILKPD